MSPDTKLAYDDVLRAAINVGRAQVYTDINPERKAWLRTDERELERANCAFWRTLNEEENSGR